MNRDDFRKALDAERELVRRANPLPPWARRAVMHTTVAVFLTALGAFALVALGFAYLGIRLIIYMLQ